MAQFPLITAHTGCMGTPDNSLASAQTALSLGADIIEDDIRVTRDGVLVLSHDDHVPCTDGQTGSLSSLTLQQLNDRAAEPVVLLETVLQLLLSHPGKRMNLDLKTDACIAPVADLVHKLNAAEHVFLTGCPYSRALQAAQQAPSLKKLLNINTDRFLSGDYLSGVKQACEEAAHAGCFGLNVPYQLISLNCWNMRLTLNYPSISGRWAQPGR